MEFIKLLLHLIELIIYLYLGFAAFYIFIFAIAGRILNKKIKYTEVKKEKFIVLIPGYKEDTVIIDVAKNACKQNYPSELYKVMVIADSFQKETLDLLSKLPITVFEVRFEKSTKSKALNAAMNVILEDYSYVLVLDADNLMEKDLLNKLNYSFSRGFVAVQAHRAAKNLNTSFAVLDAISEEINNHIFRKGHRALGFSSALIGSGMAFEYKYFKNLMLEINAVGGFDKELELRMLNERKKIEYLDDALVLDEKVQKAEVFTNQRRRWLSAQFVYFGRWFLPGLKQLILKGNFDLFDKVYQMIQPPRILLLGILSVFVFFGIVFHWLEFQTITSLFLINFTYWLLIFFLTLLAFFLSIPLKFYNTKTLIAVLTLPKGFILMLLSLFKLKGANNKFIHTQHGTN